MEYKSNKTYLIVYKIIDIIQKTIYVIMGILLPLQIGWSRTLNPVNKTLDIQDIQDIQVISDYLGFTVEKTKFYIENLTISISAIIIILIFKVTAKYEEKCTSFKIIKKVAICVVAVAITKKVIMGM